MKRRSEENNFSTFEKKTINYTGGNLDVRIQHKRSFGRQLNGYIHDHGDPECSEDPMVFKTKRFR